MSHTAGSTVDYSYEATAPVISYSYAYIDPYMYKPTVIIINMIDTKEYKVINVRTVIAKWRGGVL